MGGYRRVQDIDKWDSRISLNPKNETLTSRNSHSTYGTEKDMQEAYIDNWEHIFNFSISQNERVRFTSRMYDAADPFIATHDDTITVRPDNDV